MTYLVLSCNTGGGHNACARAIRAEAALRGIDCEVTNALQFLKKSQESLIVKGHIFAYKKIPRAFGLGYILQEHHPSTSTYEEFSKRSDKLEKYIAMHEQVCGEAYGAVICVHAFPALMMTGIRKRETGHIPTVFVATDYTCSPSVNLIDVDRWCVPRDLTAEFEENGIPREKIAETGIPVDPSCYQPVPKKQARRKLGLPEEAPMVLLSCGSMGAGHMDQVALRLFQALPDKAVLAVLTGTNKELYKKLTRDTVPGRILAQPFTDKVGLWMSAADVLITKPGGLTSTEAVTRGLPTLFLDAVPGLETHNMEYMVSRGLALSCKGTKELIEKTAALLLNKEELAAMRKRQLDAFHENSAERLLNEVEKTRTES